MCQNQPSQTEQLACDFLESLQQRRGLTASAALDQLGEWLLDYRPGLVARATGAAVFGSNSGKVVRARGACRHASSYRDGRDELTSAA